MKSFFPRFLILTLAGVALLGVSQVHAAYCWCKTDTATCENHTQTDSIGDQPVSITTTDQCNQYCKARNPSWNAIHFDSVYTDWNAKTVSQGGCLPDAASQPGCRFSYVANGTPTVYTMKTSCTSDQECKTKCEQACKDNPGLNCPGNACSLFSSITCVQAAPTAPSGPPAPGSPTTLYNPLGATTFQGLIARIIRSVIGIVGAIALLMFVYGGIIWMTAGGSETQVKKGKSILIQSTIGLLIIFFSYTLVSVFLGGFLGSSAPTQTTQSNP